MQPVDQLLPATFLERLRQIVGPEYQRCLASFTASPPVAFRINTLSAAVVDVLGELAALGLHAEGVPWYAEAFLVPATERDLLVGSAPCRQGRLYMQNLSSMLPALVLNPAPGETILDLAAAPGGKTLQMAAMMRNQGTLAAVEPIRARCYKLRDNLARCQATMVRVYRADGRSVGRKVPERFDRVLLDAPCSSEARFHVARPESWAYWSERKIREQARKQKGLLKSALRALAPGGVMVYCTCSFAPEENELVIDQQLRQLGGCVEVVPMDLPVPAQPGLTQWRDRGLDAQLQLARRILPAGPLQAFFLCQLRKIRRLPGRP